MEIAKKKKKEALFVEFVHEHKILIFTNFSYSDLPHETVCKQFKLTDNVASIKGFAIDRLKQRLSPSASVKQADILVFCRNKRLKDGQKLVDFVYPEFCTLTVQYPEGGITWQQSKTSPVLDDLSLSLFL